MINGFTLERDANHKRAEAELRAARERMIRNRRPVAPTSGSLVPRARFGFLTMLTHLRTAVQAR